MNVLFISNGMRLGKIDSLIENQANSIQQEGVCVDHFLITKPGFKGYLSAARKLRELLKQKQYDLLHAHYGFCGLVALFAFPKTPVVISFMGTDLHGGKVLSFKNLPLFLIIKSIAFIVQAFTEKIIIKSQRLKHYIIYSGKTIVIPNGVNTELFYPIAKEDAIQKLSFGDSKEHILFLGDIADENKNFKLLQTAFSTIQKHNEVEIIVPYPVDAEKIIWYLNACDILVLCSYNEGSPNSIKEAMACNCPIVSTDTGDAKEVIGNTEGCYICDYNSKDAINKILLAMEFARKIGRTNGRQRILELSLDSKSIAKRIIKVYEEVLNIQ